MNASYLWIGIISEKHSHLYVPYANTFFFYFFVVFFLFIRLDLSIFRYLQVDVYSFGLLLCEMCIRELPVPQQIQDQIGLVTNGVLRELVMRCVARAPEARPTMNDVIFVLTQQAESLRAEGLVTLNGRTATL